MTLQAGSNEVRILPLAMPKFFLRFGQESEFNPIDQCDLFIEFMVFAYQIDLEYKMLEKLWAQSQEPKSQKI